MASDSRRNLRLSTGQDQRWLMRQSRTVRLNDGSSRHIFDSATAGETIVLVPVIEQMNFVFVPLIQSLRERFRVIVYSPHVSSSERVSVGCRAAEIKLVLDSLGVELAHIVAWSDAGAGAYVFARDEPQRCKSVTFLGLPDRYEFSPVESWLINLLFQYPIHRLFHRYVVAGLIARHLAGPQVPWLPLFAEAAKIRKLSGIFRNSLVPCLVEHKPSEGLAVPALVMLGEGDRLVSKSGAAALAARLGTELVTIPAGEHFPTMLQANTLTEHIVRFTQALPLIEDGI